jgi:hypothetical protein
MQTGLRLAMLAVALRVGAGAAGALCVDAVPLPWASPEAPAACATADACCESAPPPAPADRLPPADPDCCVDVPLDCWLPPEPAAPLTLLTAGRVADPLATPAAGPSGIAQRALARLRAPPPPWVGVILLQV